MHSGFPGETDIVAQGKGGRNRFEPVRVQKVGCVACAVSRGCLHGFRGELCLVERSAARWCAAEERMETESTESRSTFLIFTTPTVSFRDMAGWQGTQLGSEIDPCAAQPVAEGLTDDPPSHGSTRIKRKEGPRWLRRRKSAGRKEVSVGPQLSPGAPHYRISR